MIREMYHGAIVRSDRNSTDPEYLKLSERWLELSDKLEQQLTPEQIDLFHEVCDVQGSCGSITAEEMYVAGFRDAARLMIEILIE
jgi:hypothetical protein